MGTTKQRVLEAVRRNRRLLKFAQQLTAETVAAWGVDEIDGTQAERDAFITDYVEEVYNDQQRSREGAGSGRQAVLVKLKKGRATAKHRFNDTPTWQQLCQAVEESFPEFEVEGFQLKDGDISLNESNWFQFARNNQSITLQVLSSAVAFSSYSEDSLRTLLNTSGAVDMYDAAFHMLHTTRMHCCNQAWRQPWASANMASSWTWLVRSWHYGSGTLVTCNATRKPAGGS